MNIPEVTVSPKFKSQVTKTIASIVLFVIAYLILVILAAILTAICVYGGLIVTISMLGIFGIIIGLGIASLGILVFIFLIKFIFSSHKVDRSHLLEITENEEPALFQLIKNTVKSADTDFPKKVYLSADVNASVFYDSSFWSMFFPIKKNLQVGLGLVNSVTESELKAILAHEFGHFSQKSMALGSYVYNMNQVIFNLLFNNQSYDNIVHTWAKASSIFGFFALIAIKIIKGIQWILFQLYRIINKTYLSLSREMEFHADEIAASITGYLPLKNALLRLSLADFSLNHVLTFYDKKIAKGLTSQNVFKEHSFVMNFLAAENDMPIVNQLPEVTVEELSRYNKSKLVIKNQWASHPSTKDRIAKLEFLNYTNDNISNLPANTLFSDITKSQEKLTAKIFEKVEYKKEIKAISLTEFKTEYEAEFLRQSFAKVYNGYYDYKSPGKLNVDQDHLTDKNLNCKDLFSDDKVDLIYSAFALHNDLNSINEIKNKSIRISTFDYDGKKYKRKDCEPLINNLCNTLEEINNNIIQNDKHIFSYFSNLEKQKGFPQKLKELYKSFFDFDSEYPALEKIYFQLQNALEFVNYNIPIDTIKDNFSELKPLEKDFKNKIKALMVDKRFENEIKKEIKENFDKYLSKDWIYFGATIYYDENLMMLQKTLHCYIYLLENRYFLFKKELLDYQETLLVEEYENSEKIN